MLAVYQATSALMAVEYGSLALAEQNIPDDGARVIPSAFTVVPSAPSVLDDVDPGYRTDRIISTLVADAGRSAMSVFTASRSQNVGNIRVLTPPSCQRCAVLAGRWYRWSENFDRHPGCDCEMIPAARSAELYDPYAAYESGDISDLSKAQKLAIDDGADIGQVVNARRGMQEINFAGRSVQVTTEGTTSRGLAFRSLSNRGVTTSSNFQRGGRRITRNVARAPRLSPGAIYKVSDGTRADAVRLLRANGYIT